MHSRSVFTASEDGFPAKRQELSGSRLIQSPTGYIAPPLVLETPERGILLFAFPIIAADKDRIEHSLCFPISVTVKRREGVGSRRIKLYPLAVGEGPAL